MKKIILIFLSFTCLGQIRAADRWIENRYLSPNLPPSLYPERDLLKAILADDPEGALDTIIRGAGDRGFGGQDRQDNPRTMHVAVSRGAEKVVKFLLENGFDVNMPDSYSTTPLSYAIDYDKPNLVRLLASYGGTIEGYPINQYLIHRSIEAIADNNNKLEVVKELLKAGAPVNGRDRDMNTPLHVAATFNNVDAINLLVSFGADLNARDRNGDTPLHKAIYFNSKKALIRLLELGAEADERNNQGQTPREYAQALCKHDLAQTTGL